MKPAPIAIVLLALCACSWPTRDDQRRVSGTIVLTGNDIAFALLPGPYISVVDRVEIRATNGAGEVIASTSFQLQRYESSGSATLMVPEGNTTFSVDVSNATGLVLYSGSATGVVSDGFEIDVPLTAQRPVLVIQADTFRSTGGAAQFSVYNGGRDSLNWSTPLGVCPQNVCASPAGGRLGAGQRAAVSFTVPFNQPTGNYNITVSSPEGSVTPVWVYTRPNVIGFAVSPKTATLDSNQVAQLNVSTQSGPPNASWTSSNTNVATVTPSGLVRAINGGTAQITAASLVDPNIRDFATITVRFPIGFRRPVDSRPP